MKLTALQALEATKAMIDEVITNLKKRGYYSPPDYMKHGMTWKDEIIPEGALRRLARRVAKDMRRPFVQVYDLYGYAKGDPDDPSTWQTRRDGIRIEMPRRRYLAPLIHPLIVAGYESRGYKTLWNFYITDIEFADAYLAFFETREEFRAALKLPV